MKSGSTRALLLATLVLCSVVFGAVAVATAAEHYDVTSAGSSDVPDRTITLDGQEFEIESVGHAEPGETIEATTQAPDGKEYILYLYDNQVVRVDFSRMTGNGSASFPTDELDPGTYVLVVRADREFQSIHPVVVAGYDPAVDTSGEVTPGEPFTVEIDPDAEEYENAPDIDSVTVLRTEDGEAVEEVEATPVDGSDTYEAELTAPDEEGDVRLVTTVLGEESIAFTSRQEILGFTDTTLTESEFEVTVDEDASTAEITENETVEIVADVENAGDFTGQETVELLLDGDAVDDVSVSLNGSESETVTLTHDTDDGDVGKVSYAVSSADSTDSLNVTVTESDETDGTDGGDSVDGPENGTDTGDIDNGTTNGGSADDGSDNETADTVDDGSDTGDTDGNGTDTGDQSANGSETTGDDSEGSDGQDSSSSSNTDDDDGSGGNDGQDSSSDTNDDDNVIEPTEPTEEEASPVSAPLTGFPHFVAAVLVIGLLAHRRKN